MRVTADNLSIKVGNRVLLDGLDFIWDGPGVVAVVGPSGAGKSTLLSALIGWTKINGGLLSVEPNGSNTWLVPQNAPLLDSRSVLENLEVALMARMSSSVDTVSISEILLTYRLEHVALTRGKHLSGGERQRVALARAALRRPQMLLADEVTAGLDHVSVTKVTEALVALARSGSRVVIATHDSRVWNQADEVLDLSRFTR